MPKPIYTFYDEGAVNPCKSRSAFHAAKLQLSHKPARGWRKFYYTELSLLHELPLMYHELSLIVLGILHHDADGSSSHVMPALACAMAGSYGCGI